jgi:hypothetical protein
MGSELLTIFSGIEHRCLTYYSGAVGLSLSVIPLREQLIGNLRPILLILMAGVGFMLFIACTNVASLLLVAEKSASERLLLEQHSVFIHPNPLSTLTEPLLRFLASGTSHHRNGQRPDCSVSAPLVIFDESMCP